MPPLSCLGSPPLTPELLALLNAHGISKVEDLLTKDLYSLPGLGSNAGAVWERDSLGNWESLTHVQKALRDVLNEVYASYGATWRSGIELFQSIRQTQFLTTGCESIDGLLQGGLRPGTITEIVGPPATGKTQLCHQATACAVYRHHAKVAYIDTTCSFVGHRLAQMLGGLVRERHTAISERSSALREALASVVRMSAHDIHAVLELLDDISLRIASKSQESGFYKQLKLVILDSATAVVSPILGGNNQGHTLMRSLGQALKALAVSHNIAVLVTNGTVADGTLVKAALGESWKNIAHVHIQLDRDPLSDISSAHLKNCVLGNGVFEKETFFRLTKNGLEAVEPEPLQLTTS